MNNRKRLILGILFSVGLISYAGVILTNDDVTFFSVLLSLGAEGLKTAVLFILIDYLIGDHERRLNDAQDATEQIRLITSGETSVLGDLLRRTSLGGGPVKLNLYSGANYSNVKLVDIDWHDSHWVGVDLSKSDFKTCRLKRITISASDLSGSVFENCIFNDVSFGDADLSNALFSRCEFIKCDFPDIQSSSSRFSQCDFWVMEEANFPKDGTIYSGCMGVPS